MAKKMVMIITPGGSILEVTEECAKRCLAKGYTKVEEENKAPRGNAPEAKAAGQASARRNAGQVGEGENKKEKKIKDNPKAERPKKNGGEIK